MELVHKWHCKINIIFVDQITKMHKTFEKSLYVYKILLDIVDSKLTELDFHSGHAQVENTNALNHSNL